MDTTEDLDLLKKIEELESTNKRMMDEYNGQRAKMKDLFLQKEAELSRKTEENNSLIDEVKRLKNELDDVKSQLVVESIKEYDFEVEKRKADEEIASLQRLIHETVEESSSNRNLYDHDLKKLQSYIQQLQKKIEQLQHENNQLQAQSSEHTLAPSVVLNAFTKGIVKKFDAFGGSQDEKSGKLQEDVELLKSLVEPLNDQINALKEKLRATDEKLQKCQECGHSKNDIDNCVEQSTDNINLQNTSTNTSFDTPKVDNLTCDMCSNYEAQLVREQQTVSELKQKVQVAEKSSDRYKEELIKEIGFRKEMEEKWNEKREEHKKQVAELTQITQCTEQDLKEMKEYFNETSEEMRAELAKLQKDRDRVAIELKTLQRENENLVGKYTLHSQQLQSEIINLPNTIEELHELVLRNHQDLVIAKVGKETAQEELKTVKNEFSYHKQKYESFQTYVKSIEEKNEELREQLQKLEKEKKSMLVKNSNLQEKDDLITQLTDSMKKLEAQNTELKARVISLQEQQENSEAVQRDFVHLSQSLQIQLEKIREADQQVRWQHEDDVDECPKCRTALANPKSKFRCKHCIQIFCHACVSRVVPSGPNQRPSKVCDVCHTLLVKSSAPYFSKEPPMS